MMKKGMQTQASWPIQFWNREMGQIETEAVYGEGGVRFLYASNTGQKLAPVLAMPWISRVYGAYQSSAISRRAIAPFIEHFKIPMEDYEPGPFHSFNEFFIRHFRESKRNFVFDAKVLPAFCEGRYLGFESTRPEQTFPVKGTYLSAQGLLGPQQDPKKFEGGPLLVARLCPVDYHRFHFPDDGKIEKEYRISGSLHSVNPLALRYKGDIFCTNERHVSILETKNFGSLAYIEVGALAVGKIVQTHDRNLPFKRGDEKGYFLFGASTVVLLGEKGRWTPAQDLLDKTSKGLETLVRLGSPAGSTVTERLSRATRA